MSRNLGTDQIIEIILAKYENLIHGAKTILVLGAGDCFLESRIKGVNNNASIDSVDIQDMRNKTYRHSVDRFFLADLNRNLPLEISENKYDLVFCLEVIEHLDNPWSVMENILKHLHSKGHIILSTPNPLNLFSRIHFLINGRFTHFYDIDMATKLNHNNPVFFWELKRIAKFMNLTIDKIDGVPYPIFKRNIT